MAKKKVTSQIPHHSHQQQAPKDQNFNNHQTPPVVEDSKEKVQNLKSLNSLLLKETVERRQQVESLLLLKEEVESEIALSKDKMSELEAELTQSSDESVFLEVEKCVFLVFIETQMREMVVVFDTLLREKTEADSDIRALKGEAYGLVSSLESERESFVRACSERDSLKRDNDKFVKEMSDLTERLMEMEKKERTSDKGIGKLRTQYAAVVKEMEEKDNEIAELKRIRESTEVNLAENLKQIIDLKSVNKEILKDKNGIEVEMSRQNVKIGELNEQLNELTMSLSNFHEEEKVLSVQILDLEKNYSDAMEREKAKAMEIESLEEQKKEKDKAFEKLMEEKSSTENSIEVMNAELNDKHALVENLRRETKEIEEVKVNQEGEIAKLNKEVVELSDAVSAMKQTMQSLEDKNSKLSSELRDYEDSLDQTRLERDNAREDLAKEKKHVANLTLEVRELETKIKTTTEEFTKAKNEWENLIKDKKEMETLINSLSEEKDMAQKNLSEMQQEVDNLRAQGELINTNMERTLAMLRATAAMLSRTCDDKEEKENSNDKKLEDEIELFVAELDVIKDAFKHNESMVEELKHQVEVLEASAEEAQKGKRFWSIVSRVTSATTVFAAVVVAYVARVR